jgi:hypothetical protein
VNVVLEPLPEEHPRQTFADGEFHPFTYAYNTKEA